MGENKIDKLFQEKLKNFSEPPDDTVWQSIEASLNQKKKSRKLIPIWWKLGGAAAVLLVAVFLINPFEEEPNISVTDVKNPIEKSKEKKQNKTAIPKDIDSSRSEKHPLVNSIQKPLLIKETNGLNEQVTQSTIDPVSPIKSNADKRNLGRRNIQKSNKAGSKIATNNLQEFDKQQGLAKASETKSAIETRSNNTAVVVQENRSQQTVVTSVEQKNSVLNKDLLFITKKEEIALEEKDADKKSIFDEIAAQKEQEKDILTQNAGSKWSAGPSIAPVYFNAFGEGSPVHSAFVPNSKSGDVTLSYGLSVAYEINKKLSIRSGVHKVDYGYNTNDVAFSSSVEASSKNQLANIDYAQAAENLIVGSEVMSFGPAATNEDSFLNQAPSDVSAESATRSGVMQQQFGYVEVPIELSYAFIDKRFGLNLIGGVSSLFLVENSVSLKSNELTTKIGEANNVQAINFSTNIGIGLNYKFTPKVALNIEPVFKYQLNTFSATEGSFQPFTIGIYSGLSFKF